MSYRIIYDSETAHKDRHSLFFRGMLTFCFFMAFVWSVNRFWPEGRELLKLLVIPGDPDLTLEAAAVFAQEVRCGLSPGDALRNFLTAAFGYGTAA